jgi:hypothetical protein
VICFHREPELARQIVQLAGIHLTSGETKGEDLAKTPLSVSLRDEEGSPGANRVFQSSLRDKIYYDYDFSKDNE